MSVDRVVSRFNPVVAALLRSPLHFLVSRGLVLLSVKGRRTGRRYDIPVGYQRDGEDLVVMVSEAQRKQWWRNFVEPAPVGLHLRGRARRGCASVVRPESDEFARHAQALLLRLPSMARVFGISYERGSDLDATQLAVLRDRIAVVRIALTP